MTSLFYLSKYMLRKKLFVLIFPACIALLPAKQAVAQNKIAEIYQDRATVTFKKLWKMYRAPGYEGLFLENYPAGKKDTLNYFQGEGVKEKAVSFLWPFSGMFSAANSIMKSSALKNDYRKYLDTLVIGIEQYHDRSRKPAGYQAYPAKLEKADRYYDDNGLVGIDYMEAYFTTKNPVYLKRAKDVFTFIQSGWNSDLGGGVPWLEGHKDQKPACTNGMATLTALKIYEGSRDKYYLQEGIKYYKWMYDHLKDPKTGIIANDMKLNGKRNDVFWTYNTGSLLESAVLLYKFTGREIYLKEAKELAKASFQYFTQKSEDKNLKFKIDLPWFVTVLFRGYESLYSIDRNYTYISAIESDLNYAWQNSKDKYGLITHSWLPRKDELKKSKWLLDQACIIELYARLSCLKYLYAK